MAARAVVLALLPLLCVPVRANECDTLCSNGTLVLTCRLRILLASDRKFSGQPAACYQAHQWVLSWCPACNGCSTDDIGSSCAAQQSELGYAVDVLEKKANASTTSGTTTSKAANASTTSGATTSKAASASTTSGATTSKAASASTTTTTASVSAKNASEGANASAASGNASAASGNASAASGNASAASGNASAASGNASAAGKKTNGSSPAGAGGNSSAGNLSAKKSEGNSSSSVGANETADEVFNPLLCSSRGCGARWDPNASCQCNALCREYKDCCKDFKSTCSMPLRALTSAGVPNVLDARAGGSCKSYGCSSKYRPNQACQCNSECESHFNCCHDRDTHCRSQSRELIDKNSTAAAAPAAHGRHEAVAGGKPPAKRLLMDGNVTAAAPAHKRSLAGANRSLAGANSSAAAPKRKQAAAVSEKEAAPAHKRALALTGKKNASKAAEAKDAAKPEKRVLKSDLAAGKDGHAHGALRAAHKGPAAKPPARAAQQKARKEEVPAHLLDDSHRALQKVAKAEKVRPIPMHVAQERQLVEPEHEGKGSHSPAAPGRRAWTLPLAAVSAVAGSLLLIAAAVQQIHRHFEQRQVNVGLPLPRTGGAGAEPDASRSSAPLMADQGKQAGGEAQE